MTNRITSIAFFLFFSLTQILAQANYKENILGVWELVEKKMGGDIKDWDIEIEPPRGSAPSKNYTSQKKDFIIPDNFLFFQADGLVDAIFFETHIKDDYSINDSVLLFGPLSYGILRLDDSSMELLLEDILGVDTFLYQRSTRKITPIPSSENVLEKYDNGNVKLKGTKEMGLKHGLWIEWHSNGQIKNVTHYDQEMALMRIEFDAKGEITTQLWFDPEQGQFRN